MTSSRTALAALFAALTLSITFPPALAADRPAPEPIPGAHTPSPGILTSGQPSEAQLKTASAAGYRTVINLRSEAELGFAWEPAEVKKLGMSYVSIPVPGAPDLTRENVARLDAALETAAARGPVLIHCASGNRVGALLALRASWLEGMDPAAALDYGRAAGLTGLEPAVRKLLGLPESADAPAPAHVKPSAP